MSNYIIVGILSLFIVILAFFWPNKKKSKGKEIGERKVEKPAEENALQAQLKNKGYEKVSVEFFIHQEESVPLSDNLGKVFTGDDIQGFEHDTLRALNEAYESMPSQEEYEFYLQQTMARETEEKTALDFSAMDAFITEMQQKFESAKSKRKSIVKNSNTDDSMKNFFSESQEEAKKIQEELEEQLRGIFEN